NCGGVVSMSETAVLTQNDLASGAVSDEQEPVAPNPHRAGPARSHWLWCGCAALAIMVLGQVLAGQISWVAAYPSDWVLPLKDWMDAFFEWLVYGARFFEGTVFEFTARNLTRGFAAWMGYPL